MSDTLVSGILNIDKPYGVTSMDVIRHVRRACGIRRVGHGGTLDPMATGVVPVCVGRATRVVEYLMSGSKEYVGEVRLGVSTDTYDATGEITRERDASSIGRERVEIALTEFEGETMQVPPMYSALKRGGRRLYELARQGVEVEREARRVVVHGVRLAGWDPPVATVEISCGRGFYVRSLAHDLGEALGCGGHLKSLTRRKAGPFHLRDSVSLDEVEERFADGSWHDILHGADVALGSMRALVVDERVEKMVCSGGAIPPAAAPDPDRPDERIRAYSADGRFLAIARFSASRRQWRPEKVFV